MRVKFSHLLPAILCIMLAWASSAVAQDDVPGPDNNSISNTDQTTYDEKQLLLDQEGRGAKGAILRDSLNHSKPLLLPTAKPTKVDPKKKEETDPLNFNFLYYIIQKFKSSDLMME